MVEHSPQILAGEEKSHQLPQVQGWTCRLDASFFLFSIYLYSVHVPVVQVKSEDCEKSCRILIHALQLVPQTQYKVCEFEKFVTISDRGDTTQAFPVMVSQSVLGLGVWREGRCGGGGAVSYTHLTLPTS